MKKLLALIEKRESFLLKSQGKSMLPLLQENDIVYFKKTPLAKIKINDLVVFRQKNQIICHRVIYKKILKRVQDDKSGYLITKGDNVPLTDGKILSQQILGKVYQVKRNGRFFNPQSLYLIQSTLYFNEIIKIKNAFEKEKINYVFLKGLPLHLYFEGTHPERIYADCDVLIEKKDFEKAQKILFKFGYKKSDSALSKIQKSLRDKEVENAYFKIINGFSVVFDLHTEVVFMMTQLGGLDALYPQRLIDQLTQEFLDTKKKVKINNEELLILHPQFLIFYLALHFFHHNFRSTFRMQILDKIIRQFHLRGGNWADLTRKILDYKLQNFVYPAFFLLKKYYQTPIPQSFLKSIQPNFTSLRFYNFKNLEVFNDESRITAGINRFKNLFFLSPNPLWRKLFVFVKPLVLYSIFLVFKRRLSSFFSNRK